MTFESDPVLEDLMFKAGFCTFIAIVIILGLLYYLKNFK